MCSVSQRKYKRCKPFKKEKLNVFSDMMEQSTQHSTAALWNIAREYEKTAWKIQESNFRKLLAPLKKAALGLSKLANISQVQERANCFCSTSRKPELRSLGFDFSDSDCHSHSKVIIYDGGCGSTCLFDVSKQKDLFHGEDIIGRRENGENLERCQITQFSSEKRKQGPLIRGMVKFSASVQVSTSLLQKTMDQQTGSLDYTNGEICPACGKCLEKEGPTNASFNMQTSNQLQCHVISPKSANLETNTASSGESIDSSTEGCLCSAPRSKRWSKNDKNIDNNKSENVISQQIYSSDRIGGQCCLDEITFTKDPPTISHNFNGQEECIYSRITAVHQQTSTIPFTKSSSKEHLSMTMTRSVVETTTTKTGVISPLPDAQFHADLNEMNFCGATQCKSNYENFLRAPCEKCAIGSIERENSDLLCTCGCGFFQGEYVEIPCCECTDSFNKPHENRLKKEEEAAEESSIGTDLSSKLTTYNLEEYIKLIREENEKLQKVLIDCGCLADGSEALFKYPPIRATHSGLSATVNILQSKCRSKDEMIAVLVEGLRQTTNLAEFSQRLTEIDETCKTMDFDHCGLYAYLCKVNSDIDGHNNGNGDRIIDKNGSNDVIPAPTEFKIDREICNCILVSWKIADTSRVTGYQILIDGKISTLVSPGTQTEAVLGVVKTCEPLIITLHAVGEEGQLSEPVNTIYSETCTCSKISMKD